MVKSLRSKLAVLTLALFTICPAVGSAQNTVTELFNQSFETATAGSEDEPVDFQSYGDGSFSRLFGYKWTVKNVQSAGGMILIKDGGNITYGSVYPSSSGGAIKLTAEVRFRDSYGGIAILKFGSTSSPATTQILLEDSEWHTITFVTSYSSFSSSAQLEPFLSASGMLVKSLKAEQSLDFLAAPTALQPTKADGTSFTATWKAITAATGYYLDVYTKGDDNTKEYVIENLEVGQVTSYEVTGLDASKTYYYVVRATDGSAASDDSNEIRVVKVVTSLDAPTALEATEISSTGFTANWSAVDNADEYIVTLNRHETLAADGMIDIFTEDFIATAGEGSFNSTSWVSNIDKYTAADGWEGYDVELADGHIALNPFSEAPATLTTPVIDLSANEGNFNVVVNMALGAYGNFYEGGVMKVNLLDSEDNVVEQHTVTTTTTDFIDYTVEFTSGTAESRIQFSYDDADNAQSYYRIFIKELAVAQLVEAGTVITNRVDVITTPETSYTFNVEFVGEVEYSYSVAAAVETVNTSGNIYTLTSDNSEVITVNDPSGVESVAADNATANVWKEANGVVGVQLDRPTNVTVCDIAGRILYNGICTEGTSLLNINTTGIVIVRVETKAVKIAL